MTPLTFFHLLTSQKLIHAIFESRDYIYIVYYLVIYRYNSFRLYVPGVKITQGMLFYIFKLFDQGTKKFYQHNSPLCQPKSGFC